MGGGTASSVSGLTPQLYSHCYIVNVTVRLFQHHNIHQLLASTTLQLLSVPNQMRKELGNQQFKMFVGTFWLTRLEAPLDLLDPGSLGVSSRA